MKKFLLKQNFLRIALKSLSSEIEPKQNYKPDFDKIWNFDDKNFVEKKISQNSAFLKEKKVQTEI